jgi:hypothetical protein
LIGLYQFTLDAEGVVKEYMVCMARIKRFGKPGEPATETAAVAFMKALAERYASGDLTVGTIYAARDLELSKLEV